MIIPKNKKYSIIDLETTGLNSLGQKIIEIAIINYDGEKIEEVFSTLLHPEKFISHGITMITGITNEMVMDCPKFYEVAKKIVEITEGRIIVAHNVFFDYRFLQREFQDLGFSYKRGVFCTSKAARSVFPGLESYSLKNLCFEFKIPRKSAHRALSDAQDCLELFRKIQNQSLVETLKDELDHLIPAQLENFSFDDYPDRPGLYFMYGAENKLLYVGKSKRIRTRLKQHFKQFAGGLRERELKSNVIRVEFMECFDDLPTGILELHFIKNLKPYYNRAGRRKKFRYALRLNTMSEAMAPGDELKLTQFTNDIPILYSFGSRKAAQRMKEQIFLDAFGHIPGDLHFEFQITSVKKLIGSNAYYNMIKEKYDEKITNLSDMNIRKKHWNLTIENNALKSIWIKNVGKIDLVETPDMRMILLSSLKKSFNLNYIQQFQKAHF